MKEEISSFYYSKIYFISEYFTPENVYKTQNHFKNIDFIILFYNVQCCTKLYIKCFSGFSFCSAADFSVKKKGTLVSATVLKM